MVRGDVAIQKAVGPWDGNFLLKTRPVAMRRAGWLGARLACTEIRSSNATRLHSLTGEVLQPLALLLLLLATGWVVAAGRVVGDPPTVAGAPFVDPGGKVGWCHAWREGVLGLKGNLAQITYT